MRFCTIIAMPIFILTGCATIKPDTINANPLIYPVARKDSQIDNYHGTDIPDPYRWLENSNSQETKIWIQQQRQLADQYLATIPNREILKDRITELWNYEKYSVPFTEAGKIFFFRNDGLQNQSILYVQDNAQQTPRVLLDPNQLSADGTIALTDIAVSPNGKILAYGISDAGSDWEEWQFLEIETGKHFSDHLQWIKFSDINWDHTSSGIYYSCYGEPNDTTKLQQKNENQKLYYHKIATDQRSDTLVYNNPQQKEWGYAAQISEDGRYLLISIFQGTDSRNRIYYQDLQTTGNPTIKLLDQFDAEYTFLGNQNNTFYFSTNRHAPRGRIIAIDIAHPEPENWREILPEASYLMRTVSILNNQLLVEYMRDVFSQINIYDLDGKKIREIQLPDAGSVSGFMGKMSDTETYYTFSNYTQPTSVYHYDFKTHTSSLFHKPITKFDPEQFSTEQVFYFSKDGTRIPMLITGKKNREKNTPSPALLYAYGGYNINIIPKFEPSYIAWMEAGGLLAVPNIRGGGEYGEIWHQTGMLDKKQNVFDDFYAAAEYLIEQGYTSPRKLAIYGRSNGGLLIGAAITQRPELFQAAFPAVAVLDMLRFQKFTIGWAWTSEYGSAEQPQQFPYLLKYSPLHNLKKQNYPSTLIMTAEYDDRVVPAHSFKFAATMQARQTGTAPIIIRIEDRAGHGAGKPTNMKIQEYTDLIAFALHAMRQSLPDSFPKAKTEKTGESINITTN